MRNLYLLEIHKYRLYDRAVLELYGGSGDETCGMFSVPSQTSNASLRIVASAGGDWDHVSVSTTSRCPTWAEMEQIKHLFFKDNEVAIQLHVPAKDHVNRHPFCLHLWRPQKAEIPLPPKEFVG